MASKFSTPFMAKSPLQGAYTSAADQGKTYVSNREAFQQLQDDIVTGGKGVDEVLSDPEKQAKRLENRIERRKKRAQKISERSGETGGYDYENPKVNELLDVESLEAKKQKALSRVEENKKKGVNLSDDEYALIYQHRLLKNKK